MMTLGEAIYAYCSGTLSVGDRVYPRRLPKDAVLPALAYQIIPAVGPVDTHSDAHSGTGPSGGFFQRVRVQFDCWGSTYSQSELLAMELRHAIHSFRGVWGDLPIGACYVDVDFDSYDQETDTYRRIMDSMVLYNEINVT